VSRVDRDSLSAIELRMPGKCEANRDMLRVSHQEKILAAIAVKELERVPPLLFTYATAVELSNNRLTEIFLESLVNV